MDMEKSRLEFLREALEADPNNAFVRYGLAMELSRYGDADEAWKHFEYLLVHHPEYLPAYYHAGMHLLNQGRSREARKVFAQGIEETGRRGDLHAQSELQAALDKLGGAL